MEPYFDEADKALLSRIERLIERYAKHVKEDILDSPGYHEIRSLRSTRSSIRTSAYFANRRDRPLVFPLWVSDVDKAELKLQETVRIPE